jgi:hypothetical protein
LRGSGGACAKRAEKLGKPRALKVFKPDPLEAKDWVPEILTKLLERCLHLLQILGIPRSQELGDADAASEDNRVRTAGQHAVAFIRGSRPQAWAQKPQVGRHEKLDGSNPGSCERVE